MAYQIVEEQVFDDGKIFDSVVIGAGQSGLAAAYELVRRGIDFIVLDANERAGGAWQHRWDSLTMHDVHGVADLPGSQAPEESDKQSNKVVPEYFSRYEKEHNLPVFRPVSVFSVENSGDNLRLLTSRGTVESKTLINATGTWTRPFIPYYPGMHIFEGEQFHTANYPGAQHFVGKRVLVVGGGASAVQFLGELAHYTEVLWVTRREPQWLSGAFDGLKAVQKVEKAATEGAAPASVVSSTGLFLRPQEYYAATLGVYDRRLPLFSSLEKEGVRWADGSYERVDSIIWATGFRPAVTHLRHLHLKSADGGITLKKVPVDVQGATTTVADPRVQMVGYGPSASTIGARHAARWAAIAVEDFLSPS